MNDTSIKKLINIGQVQFQLARLDIELIISNYLKLTREQLYCNLEKNLNTQEILAIQEQFQQCNNGMPVAYLINKKFFWDLELFVNNQVLIPRPETELLIEIILENKKIINKPELKILELGTGSGALAVTLAKLLPNAQVIATDIESGALSVAKKNSEQYNLKNLKFILSDWFDKINSNNKFDIILSNPPYVSITEYQELSKNVIAEPKSALLASDNGLDDLHKIVLQSAKYLKSPDGLLLLEHGYLQAQEVKNFMSKSGFFKLITYKDLANLDRVTVGHLEII